MTFEVFKDSLNHDAPPSASIMIHALWYAARGDWDKAHTLVQDYESGDGAWIHAYLHRVEGDLGNAAYWYRRAGRPVFSGSLDKEWEEIVRELIAR